MPDPRRVCAALGIGGLALALGATIALDPSPRLVWNPSESAPRGLYSVRPHAPLRRGDFVLAWAPPHARDLAARRGYLPRNVPLIKRVSALEGDRVCAQGSMILVNGKPVAERRATDRAGRPLPAWHGCARLRRGMLLLLMPHADSFDGRYFGPSELGSVVGRAEPLWVR